MTNIASTSRGYKEAFLYVHSRNLLQRSRTFSSECIICWIRPLNREVLMITPTNFSFFCFAQKYKKLKISKSQRQNDVHRIVGITETAYKCPHPSSHKNPSKNVFKTASLREVVYNLSYYQL